MGYVVYATARPLTRVGTHSVKLRWRSDDPWGALLRALLDIARPHVPEQTDVTQKAELVELTFKLSFEPDKEDSLLTTSFPQLGTGALLTNKKCHARGLIE